MTKIGIMYVQKSSIITELCMYKNRFWLNYVCTKIQKEAVLLNYVCTKIVDNTRFSPKNRYFSLKMAFFRIMYVQKYVKMKKF